LAIVTAIVKHRHSAVVVGAASMVAQPVWWRSQYGGVPPFEEGEELHIKHRT
jgi:hypothetical protein